MIVCQTVLRLAVIELWLSSVVALVALLLTVAIGPRQVAFRQLLWGLVLLRLVLPPGLTHPLALDRLLPGVVTSQAWLAGAEIETSATVLTAIGDESRDGPSAHVNDVAVLALLTFWALGALGLLSRDLRRVRRCRSLVHAARPGDAHLDQQLADIARCLAIKRSVRLRVTQANVSPFTVGLLRPTVVLPERMLAHGSPGAVRAIMAHELAHVARKDALWVRLQCLVQRLYFFDPIVWLASHFLHAGRELLCDERAVRSGAIDSRTYAKGLLGALDLNLGRPPGLVPALGQGVLMTRIRRILLLPPVGRRVPWAAWLAAVGLGVFILPIGGHAQPSAPSANPAAGHPGAPAGTVQDVHLANPLPGARISAPYGRLDRHPFTGKPFDHTGVDLVMTLGTPVHASGAGTVEVATTDYAPSKNAGTVIVIDHGGGLKSYYAHLGEVLVQVGDEVTQGQTIARVGNTGLSTAPHLHFEVWLNGEPTAPGDLIPGLATPSK